MLQPIVIWYGGGALLYATICSVVLTRAGRFKSQTTVAALFMCLYWPFVSIATIVGKFDVGSPDRWEDFGRILQTRESLIIDRRMKKK